MNIDGFELRVGDCVHLRGRSLPPMVVEISEEESAIKLVDSEGLDVFMSIGDNGRGPHIHYDGSKVQGMSIVEWKDHVRRLEQSEEDRVRRTIDTITKAKAYIESLKEAIKEADSSVKAMEGSGIMSYMKEFSENKHTKLLERVLNEN